VHTSSAMASLGNSINGDNRGPAIDIAVWICFILCAISIVAKVWTKLGRRGQKIHVGNLQLDDYLVVLSLVRNFTRQDMIGSSVANP
jgi:hypothetical protein